MFDIKQFLRQVEPNIDQLSSTGAAILDGFPRFYVWIGNACPSSIKIKVIELTRKMRNNQRKGKVHIVVIDSNDPIAEKSFMKKLGSSRCTSPPKQTGDIIKHVDKKTVLHRLSGEKVMYDMPVVSCQLLKQKYLVRTDSYLLDNGPSKPIYVWVGHQAASRDLADAVTRGMLFRNHNNYPSVNPVCRIREGWETDEFRQSFIDWQESIVRYKNRSKSRHNSLSCTGRVPSARSERSLCESSGEITFTSLSDGDLVDSDGSTEIWIIKDNDLVGVPWDKHGIFNNGYCYIILHHTVEAELLSHVLYYWIGYYSTSEDQKSTVKLSQSLNSSLNSTATVIRVLDGKEPTHFLTVLQHSMIVYDCSLDKNENEEEMFTVKELENGSMKVKQVEPSLVYLKSTSVVVYLSDVDCILWFGKESGGSEREYAKTILDFMLPTRMYTFDVMLEGKETDHFWNILGGKKPNIDGRKSEEYEKRFPKLLHCLFSENGVQLTEIPDFTQTDLTEKDVFIMDLFSRIIVWFGKLSSDGVITKKIQQILLEYIEADLAGRKEENIDIWFINQTSEPTSFRQLFPCWVDGGYGNTSNYELVRKKVRQENAIIHIHVDIDDLHHITKPKYDPFILLKPNLPDDVDSNNKQDHLSDSDFIEVYKLPRSNFYRLPYWKQGQITRSSKLAL